MTRRRKAQYSCKDGNIISSLKHGCNRAVRLYCCIHRFNMGIKLLMKIWEYNFLIKLLQCYTGVGHN